MKRLNPKTNCPFKCGDVREDGKIFRSYDSWLKLDGYFGEKWLTKEKWEYTANRTKSNSKKKTATLPGHIKRLLSTAKLRAKKGNFPFNLTQEYLENIYVKQCPVFEIDLAWCTNNGHQKQNSPSLDRIDPEKGYVMGNVQWISMRANAMKHSANFKQLHQFASWVKANVPS